MLRQGKQKYNAERMIGMKNKTLAGLLGIFLGDFGIHKFYLGKPGMGLLYLLFCWTAIPAIIGFIEGVMYLLSSEEEFQAKHGKNY